MPQVEDQVVDSVIAILERHRPLIQERLQHLDPHIKPFTIFAGRKEPLGPLPAIEICRQPSETSWLAIPVYKQHVVLFLDASIVSTKETYGEKMAETFGKVLSDVLNYLPEKQFLLLGTTDRYVFNSQATTRDPNYRRAAGLRTCRVTYWVDYLEKAIETLA